VRVISWVHDDAADLWPLAHVAGRPALPRFLVLVVELLTWPTVAMHLMLTRRTSPRQADLRLVAFLGEQLGRRAGGAD